MFAACGDQAPDPHAGHNHAPGEHGAHADPHGHGAALTLGTISIGSDTVSLTQLGDVHTGAGAVFIITNTDTSITEIRCWIGEANGRGSVKSLVSISNGSFHAHVEAPAVLTSHSQLWLAYTNTAGEKVSGSIDFTSATPIAPEPLEHDHSAHDHSDHSDHTGHNH